MKNSVLFLSLLFLISCGGNQHRENTVPEQNQKTVKTSKSNALEISSSDRQTYSIQEQGSEIAQITIASGEISINFGGENFSSRMRGDKRKYYHNGVETYEVKHKAEAFKLRTPSAQLLWKIKLYPEKIKISDNEENQNPYQIKLKEDGRAKVDEQENELGKVKYKPEAQKIVVESAGNGFSIKNIAFRYSFGLLLCNKIPREQQIIIIAELLRIGR